MIPGSNLLNIAFQCITPVPFEYIAFTGNTERDDGVLIPSYAAAVTLYGSVQALSRNQYKDFGLSYSKSYIEIFTSNNIYGIERDRASDIVQWNGRRYAVSSEIPWQAIDGWDKFIAVDIGAAI